MELWEISATCSIAMGVHWLIRTQQRYTEFEFKGLYTTKNVHGNLNKQFRGNLERHFEEYVPGFLLLQIGMYIQTDTLSLDANAKTPSEKGLSGFISLCNSILNTSTDDLQCNQVVTFRTFSHFLTQGSHHVVCNNRRSTCYIPDLSQMCFASLTKWLQSLTIPSTDETSFKSKRYLSIE